MEVPAAFVAPFRDAVDSRRAHDVAWTARAAEDSTALEAKARRKVIIFAPRARRRYLRDLRVAPEAHRERRGASTKPDFGKLFCVRALHGVVAP